jgi:hypothetical protein
MMKDVKPIIVTDDETGMEFTLEFTRESVRFAESRGFKIQDVSDYPMTKIPELWFYAFRANHKNVARNKTDKLLDGLGGIPDGLLERLGELYAAPFSALTDGQTEENPRVTVKL